MTRMHIWVITSCVSLRFMSFCPSCKSKGSGSFGGSKEAMIIIEPMQFLGGWEFLS